MQFIKEHVPDKRWQSGQRPVVVESNPIFWILWIIVSQIEKLFKIIRVKLEKSFKIIDNPKEEKEEAHE